MRRDEEEDEGSVLSSLISNSESAELLYNEVAFRLSEFGPGIEPPTEPRPIYRPFSASELGLEEPVGIHFLAPNVPNLPAKEEAQYVREMVSSYETKLSTWGVSCVTAAACLLLPPFGWCYLRNRYMLVDEGEYGVTVNNGRIELLPPGPHCLAAPWHQPAGKRPQGSSLIQELQALTLLRVPSGW